MDPFAPPRPEPADEPAVGEESQSDLRLAVLHRAALRVVLGLVVAFAALLGVSALGSGSALRPPLAAACLGLLGGLGLALLLLDVLLIRALAWAWWKVALVGLGVCTPPLTLPVLLAVVDRAGRELKRRGVQVGLLGASKPTLARLRGAP